MIPLDKLLESLLKLDEVRLIELLDINAEDILERFEDKVIERNAYLAKEVELMVEEDMGYHKELNFND